MLGQAAHARVDRDAYFTERAAVLALPATLRRYTNAGVAPLPGLIWEPGAGAGHIARPLRELGYTVFASDIAEYGFRLDAARDFLEGEGEPFSGMNYAVVMNPPFNAEAERFLERALTLRFCSVVWALLRLEFSCAGDGLVDEFARRELFDHPKFAWKIELRWRLKWETPAGAIVSERTGKPEGPRHNYAWCGWNLAGPDRRDGARLLFAERPFDTSAERLGPPAIRLPKNPRRYLRGHDEED